MTRVIAHPVARDAAGRLLTVPAGSQAHAEQAINVLTGTTPRGRYVAKPSFGVGDPVGRTVADADDIRAAAARWLPFVEVLDVSQQADTNDPAVLHVTVTSRIAGT